MNALGLEATYCMQIDIRRPLAKPRPLEIPTHTRLIDQILQLQNQHHGYCTVEADKSYTNKRPFSLVRIYHQPFQYSASSNSFYTRKASKHTKRPSTPSCPPGAGILVTTILNKISSI